MSFNVGENVGPYRIIEQLGQGGMATVFKAYHPSLDRYVALKVLHPAINQDPNFEARFQREARVVAKLEHSNIVPVYDYAEHDKRPYLVMKFVEGQTLKARMDQGPLTPEEITNIVDAVGSALAYAHKQGVLHRDIKPSNVLLTNDGQIYLADFGLARMAQAGESTLSSDMMMGTPQYISPEQAMGKGDLDQRTDLYSFGVMLYEILVGKVPFSADTPFSIIHDHIYTPLPLPRTVNPDVPEQVERFLLKALAKERDDRFNDSMKLVTAFKKAWDEANVPIQGSDLSASQVVQAEKETVAQPQAAKPQVTAEPTKIASAPAEAAEVEEKVKETEAVDGSKKRKRWMWIGAGAIVIVFLCLGILTRMNRNNAPDRVVNEPDAPEVGPGGVVGEDRELIDELRINAEEHPDDPFAQLELAVVYWETGQPRKTYETVPEIVKAAEPGNEGFFREAGDAFLEREAWIPASAMYFQVMRINQQRGEIPEDVVDVFHEAVYKGAELPEANAIFPVDAITEVDEAMAFVVKARIELFHGRVAEGRIFLNQAKRMAPDMPEVIMLQAEFDRHDGKPKEARDAMKELLTNPSIPEWIRIFAEEFLQRTL
ncbi:MAG TPA: serine/threonine-protein kinase [Anaerolineales bacterium]|nr:serine/threonine-protein kinase [Anaerolineales bacterium]